MVEPMDVCSVREDSGSHGEWGLKFTKRAKLRTARLVFATTAEVWEASRVYNNHRGLGCRFPSWFGRVQEASRGSPLLSVLVILLAVL